MTGRLKGQSGSYRAELDFSSPLFDPALALVSVDPPMELPFAVRPLDNVSKCVKLVPPPHALVGGVLRMKGKNAAEKEKKRAKDRAVATAAATAAKPVPQQPKPKLDPAGPGSILHSITHTYPDGPFSVLLNALKSKLRIRVTIRSAKGVRGTCSGILKAFDKHMNLVLLDVDETYTPALQKKWMQKSQSQSVSVRHVAQLFVKGDNVVLVSLANGK